MFTGIVQTTAEVIQFENQQGSWRLGIKCEPKFLTALNIGASIAIDGTCLTVVEYDRQHAFFDLIAETLQCTCLGDLTPGDSVNLERAARFGDEIGGHLLSGHIQTTATLTTIDTTTQQYILTCKIAPEWISYIFPKGYIALSGISLTVVNVDPAQHTFTVHLIPETLRVTTLKQKIPGMKLNIEIDSQTQTIVDTVAAILSDKTHAAQPIKT